jgi:hypothetical protein
MLLGQASTRHRRLRRAMRSEFIERRPLVVSTIGAAPYGDLAAVPGLFCESLDAVIAVMGAMLERHEASLSGGIRLSDFGHELLHISIPSARIAEWE